MRQNSPRTLSQRFARAALAGATLLAIIDTAQPAAAAQPAVATQPAPAAAAAGAAAIASVDLAGTWSFTPTGRGATSITVPGGGWYKQGFTDVNEAVYSRNITVPDSGQPQSTWIEFGAV
ncbi:MAG TPA: beta-galactosidase, partial [Kutzneria sp.]